MVSFVSAQTQNATIIDGSANAASRGDARIDGEILRKRRVLRFNFPALQNPAKIILRYFKRNNAFPRLRSFWRADRFSVNFELNFIGKAPVVANL